MQVFSDIKVSRKGTKICKMSLGPLHKLIHTYISVWKLMQLSIAGAQYRNKNSLCWHLITETEVLQFDPQIMVGLPQGTQVTTCDSGLLASNALSQLSCSCPQIEWQFIITANCFLPRLWSCQMSEECLLNLEYYTDFLKKSSLCL